MAKRRYKEIQVYKYIVAYVKENLYAPSVREICEAVKLSSTSSVYRYLEILVDEGKIEMKDKTPRTIKIIGFKVVELQ